MPVTKPPFPAQKGFRKQPTNINNVETFANVSWIIENGGAAFASMGTDGSKGTKVDIKGTISLSIDGEIVFGPYEVTCQGTVDEEGNPVETPTVLQAVNEALIMNEIASENDGMGITSVTIDGTTYANGNDEVNIYRWFYTVNGAEPKAGRAGNNALVDGDDIVYTFHTEPINPDDLTPVYGE